MSRRAHNGITDLRRASVKRKLDASRLLKHGEGLHGRGAAYLGGYAVECKLKAVALEVYDCLTLDQLASKWDMDDRHVYTHGLEFFARRLPLWNRLQDSPVWRDFVSHVNRWRPSWRYNPHILTDRDAEVFMGAVDRVLQWLDTHH